MLTNGQVRVTQKGKAKGKRKRGKRPRNGKKRQVKGKKREEKAFKRFPRDTNGLKKPFGTTRRSGKDMERMCCYNETHLLNLKGIKAMMTTDGTRQVLM